MRQVRDNPKLETVQVAALTEKECTIKVTSCGQQYKNDVTCHRFYKCKDGKAYSCQNPKWPFSQCSGKYWGIGGKNTYLCTNYKDVKTSHDVNTPEEVQKYNEDMCR